MKVLGILILAFLLSESLNIVLKKSEKNLNSKVQIQKNQVQAIDLTGYPETVLKELNYYRRKNHYSPFIRWLDKLAATAGEEAQHIVSKNSFGDHANFGTWKQKLNSRFFTELSLIVDTEGLMPSKKIFAKTVIEALKSEQEWYLIHPYTQGGVAIVQGQKKNIYIVVLHLIRRPSSFHSCEEANLFGKKEKELVISNDGQKIKVKCDQETAGGGWTRVLDMSQKQLGVPSKFIVIKPINDLGLQYSELYFKAKPNYYFDYLRGGGGNANHWDFNGYIFPLNAFKFDNIWYMSSVSPTHVAERNQIPHQYFDKNDLSILEVLKGADKCYFGKANKPAFCAKEFILKKLPKGRLTAISDVESILNKWTGDNSWDQFYEIYLR